MIASNTLADFSRDGVDVAVRHGLGRYGGLASGRVVSVEIVPVAAPALVERLGRPATPAALTRWPLVHDAEGRPLRLVDTTMLEAFACYLVYPDARGASPKIAAFRRGILDAAWQDTSAGAQPATSPPAMTMTHPSGRPGAKTR